MAGTDDGPRERVLAAIDKEVEELSREKEREGVTNWAVFIALGTVLLYTAALWEKGGLDLSIAAHSFLAASFGFEALLRLLGMGFIRSPVPGIRVWELPLGMAVAPPSPRSRTAYG